MLDEELTSLPHYDVDQQTAARIAQRMLDELDGRWHARLHRLWSSRLEPALVSTMAGIYLVWVAHLVMA